MGVGEGRGAHERGLSASAVETLTWPRSEGCRGHQARGARARRATSSGLRSKGSFRRVAGGVERPLVAPFGGRSGRVGQVLSVAC